MPIAYQRAWTDANGRLFAYRSDSNGDPLHQRPESIGFERYYYSQILPDGTRDNESFEDLFGRVETDWPGVIAALDARQFTSRTLRCLYQMATIMRTRGPAARDYNESLMVLETRTSLKAFKDMGKLPEKLERYENELDTVEVTIDRQRTLGKMSDDMKRFAELTIGLGFEIVENQTGIDFITSDNPVAYYDAKDRGIRQPYYESNTLELWFPLSPRHVLHGSHRLARNGQIPGFRTLTDADTVYAINRTTARFGYRLILARDTSQAELISQHARTSPVLHARVVRTPRKIDYHIGHKFGSRPDLVTFRPELCEGDLYEEDFRI